MQGQQWVMVQRYRWNNEVATGQRPPCQMLNFLFLFYFQLSQKSTACWWPFPPFWHPGSQLFLKALKSLMCLECARKTLTLGDMSANGVKEDKVSRIFFFCLTLFVCTKWESKLPHPLKQTKTTQTTQTFHWVPDVVFSFLYLNIFTF